MNIEKKLIEIGKRLAAIPNMIHSDKNRKKYDKVGFVHDLDYTVSQLEHFYKLANRKGTDPSSTYYNPKTIPKEHQVAYVNLTRSFPKELFGGHYCYVVKNLKTKLWIIPLTSIKDEGNILDDLEYPLDVDVLGKSILQLSDMRCIDMQRIYVKKGIFNVKSDRKEIESVIKNLFETVDLVHKIN